MDNTVIEVVGTIGLFTILTVIVWQVLKIGQARLQARQDRAYQRLAEEVSATQQRISAALAETAENLGEIRARMGAIEKLMREVE